MRKWLWTLVLILLCGPAQAGLRTKLGLHYSLLLDQHGKTIVTSLLEGLESGDSFRLSIRPGQKCYVYLVAQREPDEFRLLYPHGKTQRGKNLLPKKKAFVWPQEGWLKVDRHKGTERMYLILAAERIYELEARFALSEKSFPESVMLDIRDRYQADSTYSRELDDENVKVKFKSRGVSAVLIEEITLRHM